MKEQFFKNRLKRLASKYHIESFRPGQEETMLSVLGGQDTLAIMPTGAGKSLCYQLPAEISAGTTIVVSPLISLMKDQHKKIADMGLVSQPLSSELTRKQTEDAIQRLGEGRMDIQFVTPEKLENPDVLHAFKRAGVSMFVVDEAHCISEWGHDFRPAYRGLSKAIEALGHPPILALTATATPEVVRDIRERLAFRNQGRVVRISYRRDNLILKAYEFATEKGKLATLLRLLLKLRNLGQYSGIVYCASVRQAEALAVFLKVNGFPVLKYHGRMKKHARRRAQELFMSDDGKAHIMVATSAFGMGIDKPDVRFVINYQIPSSLEAYSQEMGRAGRDGKTALGILFHGRRDLALHRVLHLRKYPTPETLMRVTEALFRTGDSGVVKQTELEAEVGRKKVSIILKELERIGCLTLNGRAISRLRRPNEIDLKALFERWGSRKKEDHARLLEVTRYVRTGLCRWYYLLRYFGEELFETCGHCDNCRATMQRETESAASPMTGYGKGDQVLHTVWGVGEVLEKIGPNLKVSFPGVGEKMLREGFVSRPRRQDKSVA